MARKIPASRCTFYCIYAVGNVYGPIRFPIVVLPTRDKAEQFLKEKLDAKEAHTLKFDGVDREFVFRTAKDFMIEEMPVTMKAWAC